MSFLTVFCTLFLASLCFRNAHARPEDEFYTYYSPLWGQNHFSINPQKTEVQLLFDQEGGAGFRSNADYGSGIFHIKMKIPRNKTRGIVPNFYLTSAPDNQDQGNHYELDWEFLGTENAILQTNVFDNDGGNRQQKFKLWFDPSEDFHAYEILWNPYQIVFIIDSIPVRVFKNNKQHGIDYPTGPMHIEASIWHADFAGPVTWANAPFITYYTDFQLWACKAQDNCASEGYFWNKGPFYQYLTDKQRDKMDEHRKRHMVYDYCQSPKTWKPECAYN